MRWVEHVARMREAEREGERERRDAHRIFA
jgi:hypothetical protein